MSQLIQITTTNVQYELKVEHAKLEYKQDLIPNAKVNTTSGSFKMSSQRASLNIDTYEARKSLGLAKVGDAIADNVQKGAQGQADYMQRIITQNRALGDIASGTKIEDLVRNRMAQQPSSVTVFLPSTGADISYQEGSLETSYDPGTVSHDWDIKDFTFEYIPGSVDLIVTQMPSVSIEYVGETNFLPKGNA